MRATFDEERASGGELIALGVLVACPLLSSTLGPQDISITFNGTPILSDAGASSSITVLRSTKLANAIGCGEWGQLAVGTEKEELSGHTLETCTAACHERTWCNYCYMRPAGSFNDWDGSLGTQDGLCNLAAALCDSQDAEWVDLYAFTGRVY